jgi:hypothetical protein
VKGFLKMLLDFGGACFACSIALFCLEMMLPGPLIGLPLRLHGWKSSLRSSTKLDGNSPTMRLSRFNLPIHHDPSPALSTSIRSPSMKPRSRLVWKRRSGWLQQTLAPISTHLSAPRIHSFTPARKARRQRLSYCHRPRFRGLLRECRRATHQVGVRRPGGVRFL